MNGSSAAYVWMNGEFVSWAEAKIPILTHALHYGTAVFEGIRAYPSEDNLYIFRQRDHYRRMMQSALLYYIDHQYTIDELANITVELVKKNKMRSRTYIRPIIYVGCKSIGLNFTGFPINVSIIAIPFENYFDNPELRLRTSSWRRFSEQSTPPLSKASGNYLNSVLGKLEAVKDGYDDAVMLDMDGFVSEGTGENIFIVNDGKLVTPPFSSSILRGITRDTVICLAEDHGISVKERRISRFELYNADEAFFSGTAAEIAPIIEVDRRKIGDGHPGKITQNISRAYRDLVYGNSPNHREWLTQVY
jgi:branched-chain amino acid aminotransferase